MSDRQVIPYSAEWELPWGEQSMASHAAQAIDLALGFTVDGDEWGGSMDQARQLVGALREVETILLAGFEHGWGASGRFNVAVLRQELAR